MKLLIATRNGGKFREIQAAFRDTPIPLVSLADLEVEETSVEDELEAGSSFAENALAKARYFHDLTGLPTLAEDSGLEVDVLGGEPGIRSRRYAPSYFQREHGVDRANNIYLLRALDEVPEEKRAAHFTSAIAFVMGDVSATFEGRVDGVILRAPRGDGGFGYDPLFYLPERKVTTAMLTPEKKNEISHRGQAARRARDWLLQQMAAKP